MGYPRRAVSSHTSTSRARPPGVGRKLPAVYPRSMFLGELVDVSRRVGATSSRLDKITIVAGALRQLAPAELEIGVAYLSGYLTQGRIGLGWTTLEGARHAVPELSPYAPPA